MNDAELKQGIAAGASYIAARVSPDALWRDFETKAGLGTDWVSAFICYATKDCEPLRDYCDRALKALLVRQRPNGGWSYNEIVPPDCDSTCWTMLALSTRDIALPSTYVKAKRYVLAHQDAATGGFTTYNSNDGIDRFIGATDPDITKGWRSSHPCVTSLAAQALLVHGESPAEPQLDAALSYLLRARDSDGLWTSYWWPGTAYGTCVALRALLFARAMDSLDTLRILRTIAQAQPSPAVPPPGHGATGVFDTSLRVLTLLSLPDDTAFRASEACVEWLLRVQLESGAWRTCPILRIPPPMMTEPERYAHWGSDPQRGSGVTIADRNGLFTSAAALWALTMFRNASS